MITISLQRAVEELAHMLFTQKYTRVCVYCCRQHSKRFMYERIYREIQDYIVENHLKGFYNSYDWNNYFRIELHDHRTMVDFYSDDDLFRGRKYDLVFAESETSFDKINELKLLLKVNVKIPTSKQVHIFDLSNDMCWFEDEYKEKLVKDIIASSKYKFESSLSLSECLSGVRKQFEHIKLSAGFQDIKQKKEDAFDQTLFTKLIYDMTTESDKQLYENLLGPINKGEKENMNMTYNAEMSNATYATMFDTRSVCAEPVYTIKGFEIVVPDKVIKVLFSDGEAMKLVCHEDDTFDLRRGLFIAIAKKKYKDKYTWEGIEMMADKMMVMKEYVKIVDGAIKQYNAAQKAIAKQKAKEEEERRIAENKKRKHEKYLKRRDEKRQREKDEELRKKFEYDVAVQVEAARRIREDEQHLYCYIP